MDTTVKATAVSGHQREYLFDNYKVLLILLVVIGHFIEPSNDQNPFLYELNGNRGVPHARFYLYFRIFFQTDSILKKKCFVDWSFPILYTRFFIIFYTPLYWTKRPAFILQGRNFPSGI